MQGMMKRSFVVGGLLILLSACALNPVMAPFAVQGAAQTTPEQSAVVWGMYDEAQIFFKGVNGESLPSRGGGGYPISLVLVPGVHRIEALYWKFEHGSGEQTKEISVEAGHTYVVEPAAATARGTFDFTVRDLGTSQKCRFERYEEVRGRTRLICG